MKLYRNQRSQRSGVILVFFVVLLPVLIGFVGLVIDTGYLMATLRQTQNAADAAALAAAKRMLQMEEYPGSPGLTPEETARDFARRNGMGDDAQVDVYIGPQRGPYTGNAHFVEVVIGNPWQTFFIQVLGIGRQQRVVARAVAGFEFSRLNDVIILLDPTASPGLKVSGTGVLRVEGGIAVNSEADPAARVDGGGTIYASSINVVGLGVHGSFPVEPGVGQLPAPDPFLYSLHPPTTTTPNEVLNQFPDQNVQNTGMPPKDVSISMPSSGQVINLYPGIYQSIGITGGNGGTVIFNPGIYVLAGGDNGHHALTIQNTGGQVVGNGVMFYNTGGNYNWQTGSPDNDDGSTPPPVLPTTDFGNIRISSQSITFSPYSQPGSPFDKMLLYQRPWNTQPVTITGGGGVTNVFYGGMYARWAELTLAGAGSASGTVTLQSQIAFGSLTVTGNAVLNPGLEGTEAFQVFLVE